MISEDMLRSAAAEAADMLNRSLPEPEDCTHVFSERFEQKMKKLTRRARHPAVYRTLQTAACVALAMIVGFCSVLTVSAKAREAFFRWVQKTFSSAHVYYAEDQVQDIYETETGGIIIIDEETDRPSVETIHYELNWVPDGYTLASEDFFPDGQMTVFTNAQEQTILFSSDSSGNQTLMLDQENCEVKTVNLGETAATLYLDKNPQNFSTIVWTTEDGGTLLSITGKTGEKELVQMAENILPIQEQ